LLIGDDPKPTAHSQIMQARENCLPIERLLPILDRLKMALDNGSRGGVVSILRELVPEYRAQVADSPAEPQPVRNAVASIEALGPNRRTGVNLRAGGQPVAASSAVNI